MPQFVSKIGLMDSRALFECPRVILLIHLLVSFIHFWGSLGGADSALFSAYDLLRK